MTDVPITGYGFLFTAENSDGMGYVQIQMKDMPVPDADFLYDVENLFERAGYTVEFSGDTVDVRVYDTECGFCQQYSQRLDSVTRLAHGLVRKVSYYRNKLFQAIDMLDDPDDVLSLFDADTIEQVRESMPSSTPPAGVGDRRPPTRRNY